MYDYPGEEHNSTITKNLMEEELPSFILPLSFRCLKFANLNKRPVLWLTINKTTILNDEISVMSQ